MTALRLNFAAPATRLAMAAVLWLPALWQSAHAEAAKAPTHIQTEIPQARLAGEGTFRWFGLKIYDARFWVGDKGYVASAPTASPYALDLRYARHLVGAKIAESSQDEMKKLNLGSPEKRAAWRAQMDKIFPDVEEGTHITGVYLPNKGIRFYRDGTQIGEVMDPEFAAAFFAIWLNPKTSAKSLRDALLTDAAPR